MRQVTDQVGVELTDLLLCEDSVLAVLPPPRHVLVLKGDEAVIRVDGELLPDPVEMAVLEVAAPERASCRISSGTSAWRRQFSTRL